MKDKPHKWGTKLFMVCCAAFCIRYGLLISWIHSLAYRFILYMPEIYCGKKSAVDDSTSDKRSGPAAVIRNLVSLSNDNPDPARLWRLVVTDRFYTSVALSIQLLAYSFYTVGTIQTNRLGFCKAIIDKRKQRPTSVARGTFTTTASLAVPRMKAICWWDNRPVYMLSTGGSVHEVSVQRREKTGEKRSIPCPKFVQDYQKYMGGVDVHDQLRLQRYPVLYILFCTDRYPVITDTCLLDRYSLQRSVRFKKYYKSLFPGGPRFGERIHRVQSSS
jgi:hypothetical protein